MSKGAYWKLWRLCRIAMADFDNSFMRFEDRCFIFSLVKRVKQCRRDGTLMFFTKKDHLRVMGISEKLITIYEVTNENRR